MKQKTKTTSTTEFIRLASGWFVMGMIGLALLQGLADVVTRRYDRWREAIIVDAIERAVTRVAPVNYVPSTTLESGQHYNDAAAAAFCASPTAEWIAFCEAWKWRFSPSTPSSSQP